MQKTTKRILLGLLSAVAVLIAAYAFHQYYRTTPGVQERGAAATISAGALLNAFESNAAAATKKFTDAIVQVQGRIKAIDAGKPAVLSLGSDASMSSVQCSMDSTGAAQYGILKIGDTAWLKGIVTGFRSDPLFGTDVILNHCVVVQQ